MCDAWIELGKYVIQERQLRESLNDNQIAYSSEITPMVIYGRGNPEVYNSRFSGWLIECCERGYYKFDDIPAEFRDKWKKMDGVTKEVLSL